MSGGLFSSAVGIAPSDILVEGDAFITPETSYMHQKRMCQDLCLILWT
jgi:hypothetical protein